MAASLKFTVSTPIRLASYDSALRIMFNVRKMYQLPCPVIGSVFVDAISDNQFSIRNEDWGFLIDDEEGNSFDLDEQNIWDNYMSDGLGSRDWRKSVEDTDYGHSIDVTVEQLERLMQLSIKYGRVKSPLEPCSGNPERFRVRFSGSSDDEPVYFFLDQNAFVELAAPDEIYCIHSAATPSNDVDYFYVFAEFYKGANLLKSYRVLFEGVDFSKGQWREFWPFVEGLFSDLPNVDMLLQEFSETSKVEILESFIKSMVALKKIPLKSGRILLEC